MVINPKNFWDRCGDAGFVDHRTRRSSAIASGWCPSWRSQLLHPSWWGSRVFRVSKSCLHTAGSHWKTEAQIATCWNWRYFQREKMDLTAGVWCFFHALFFFPLWKLNLPKSHGSCCTDPRAWCEIIRGSTIFVTVDWLDWSCHDEIEHVLNKTRSFAADMGVSENSVPLFTQWFCWSLSLLNGYFIGNIPYFQTNPYWRMDFLICKFWWFGDDPTCVHAYAIPLFRRCSCNLHMRVGWVQHGPTFYHVQSNYTGHFVQNTSQTEGVGLFTPTKIESVHSRIPDVHWMFTYVQGHARIPMMST